MVETWIALVVGVVVGGGALWWLGRSQQANLRTRLAEREAELAEVRASERLLRDQAMAAANAHATAAGRLSTLEDTLRESQLQLAQASEQVTTLNRLLAQAQADARNASANLTEAKASAERRLAELKQDHEEAQARLRREFQQAQEALKAEFQALAQRILEEKSQSFKTQNKEQLDALLAPYRQKLDDLKQSVEKATQQDSESRGSITTLIQQLQLQTVAVSQQAHNLAEALKANNKVQGDWGEEVLKTLLDLSGMVEGLHYETQVSERVDGELYRPDVVINLPGERCVIIDSKVNLVAYNEAFQAQTEVERTLALDRHVDAMKERIKELKAKPYTELRRGRALEYVLMFVPIEAAYMAGLQHDRELNRFALKHNILLVSPTFLMPLLKLIQNMWADQKIKDNMLAIADRGSRLLDKFTDFVKDLQDVGEALGKAQRKHAEAFSKLSEGSGNLIGQAKKLHQLGARAKKQLPAELLELAEADDLEPALPAADLPLDQ